MQFTRGIGKSVGTGPLVRQNGATVNGAFNATVATIPPNGMYLSAANQLGWAVNSATAMTLDPTLFHVGGAPAQFDGNISAANLSRGTWSPNFVGLTSGGCSPTSQLGSYSRYPGGAMLSFMFSCSAHNMVGSILMTGLPFSTLVNYLGSLIISDFGNWAGSTLGQVLCGISSLTQGALYLYKTDTTGTLNIPATAFSTSGFTVRGSLIMPLAT